MDIQSETLKKPRLLIVDDNPSIHEDLIKVLARSGSEQQAIADEAADLFDDAQEESAFSLNFDIDSAYQGQEAYALVKKALEEHKRYCLAFVDIRMPPGWDGIETISHLWKLDPGLHVIVCTAYSDYSLDQIIHKIGMNDRMAILKKPFDNIEALQLANALSHKWSLQEESNFIYEELLQRSDQQEKDLQAALARIQELEATLAQLQSDPRQCKV